MSDLETRQLRYFVAVAEELNFGRAAARLGMAQPPLSRAIRDLERQLGVALLERTTRRVRLTPSGEVLLRDARTALDAVSAAGRRAQHAGEAAPRLRVALKADVDGGLLPRILEAYAAQEAGPSAPVALVLGRYGDQAAALRDGRADVGLVLDPADAPGLDFEPLKTEPYLVAVAAGDPLAGCSEVALADLAGRILPGGGPAESGPVGAEVCGAEGSAGRGGDWFGAGARAGVSAGAGAGAGVRTGAGAEIGRGGVNSADLAGGSVFEAAAKTWFGGEPSQATDLPEIFRLIELGSIVCFFPASLTRRYPRPDIVYLPVKDLAPGTLAVAWPKDSRSPAVAAFVRAAVDVAAAG